MKRKLLELISILDDYQLIGDKNTSIYGVADNSREVKKGYLFVAIDGMKSDGHEFISDAVKNGAVAVVVEKQITDSAEGVCFIKVEDSRKALALIASNWYDNPSKKMKVVGVTGTDGKTTTANLISWILNSSGKDAGVISTINAQIAGNKYDTGFHVTTPEPLKLHKFLSDMVEQGSKIAVLEVTSHGIQQCRIHGIDFDIGVLTNITNEHLDYHTSYENYLLTKVKFLNETRAVVINKKDESFVKVIKLLNQSIKVYSYPDGKLDPKIKQSVKKRFPEKYNQLNAEAAVIAARLLGVSGSEIAGSVRTFPPLRGRLESIRNNKGLDIFVDFAHTPNALENVLRELRKDRKGKLIAVFGCAGERDRKKRSVMGEIAAKLTDITIFTAEDPRSEDVNVIIDKMITGAKSAKANEASFSNNEDIFFSNDEHYYIKVPERGEAIFRAINSLAGSGDTIVVCGKGHERSMCYGKTEYVWSDHQAIKQALMGKILRLVRRS